MMIPSFLKAQSMRIFPMMETQPPIVNCNMFITAELRVLLYQFNFNLQRVNSKSKLVF